MIDDRVVAIARILPRNVQVQQSSYRLENWNLFRAFF